MESRTINVLNNSELPFQLFISFKKVYEMYSQFASNDYQDHPYHSSTKAIIKEVDKYPFLIEGFTDFSLIEKYSDVVNLLLDPLFPELLQTNEIKAASIPFSFESFKFTKRFLTILQDAGDDYELTIRNFPTKLLYIQACTFVLNHYYGFSVDVKRPFFFDIPNKKSGIIKHYRVAFNGDFSEITPTEKAPEITEEDFNELLDNFDNIELWKQKFPPNSYIFKGFGILNLFDVTADESIAGIREELLKTEEDFTIRIQEKVRDFFNINDLRIGFSVYDVSENNIESAKLKKNESIILSDEVDFSCDGFFCNYFTHNIFDENKPIAISNVKKYGEQTQENGFFKQLERNNIGSIIIIPIIPNSKKDLVLLEIASPRPYELNSLSQQKLQDVIPAFKTAIERSSTEYENLLDAIIQEHYTSIHPTVKWRFIEAAEKYQKQIVEKNIDVTIDEIVFDEVYPLYGQADIKGSSVARNKAIQEDLITQLTLAISVLDEACKTESMPIYNELMFRVEEYLNDVKKGLHAGDEVDILTFLRKEIYPVFKHIKSINNNLKTHVKDYLDRIDEDLHVVYEKRKAYESSVTLLNDKLASYIDKKQQEAQQIFPHYFERYKTDGIEYNLYMGQSLVKDKKFDKLYLYNLRLWQLQLMCELENVALKTIKKMDHELHIASLILVHSNSLAIKFRMDEKQFDVNGAYNIRYEIIKKRIDKAYVKDTNERLTVPGKIAIVYTQESDAFEYLKYIKYLQAKKQLGEIEMLEIEDLQGISGLKAIRVEVIYDNDFNKKTMTVEELFQELK